MPKSKSTKSKNETEQAAHDKKIKGVRQGLTKETSAKFHHDKGNKAFQLQNSAYTSLALRAPPEQDKPKKQANYKAQAPQTTPTVKATPQATLKATPTPRATPTVKATPKATPTPVVQVASKATVPTPSKEDKPLQVVKPTFKVPAARPPPRSPRLYERTDLPSPLRYVIKVFKLPHKPSYYKALEATVKPKPGYTWEQIELERKLRSYPEYYNLPEFQRKPKVPVTLADIHLAY